MLIFKYKNIEIEIDKNGFMEEPEQWNREVAEVLAIKEHIELTEDHWEVINYIREYYLKYDLAPTVDKLCKRTGFTVDEIFDMFHSVPGKNPCKIAGLAKNNKMCY